MQHREGLAAAGEEVGGMPGSHAGGSDGKGSRWQIGGDPIRRATVYL